MLLELSTLCAIALAGRWLVAHRESARLSKRIASAFARLPAEFQPRTAGSGSRREVRLRGWDLEVTVHLEPDPSDPDRAIATANAAVPGEGTRLHLAWGAAPLSDFSHVPTIAHPRPGRMLGPLTLQADDARAVEEFLLQVGNRIVDLKREAGARSLRLVIRGGHCRVTLEGATPSTFVVELLASTTAAVAHAHSRSESDSHSEAKSAS